MKMIKLSSALLAGSLILAAVSAQAADEAAGPLTTTGSVAFTSDYLFRGISQSDNNAAVQGALTLSHSSGVYFTAWGSSIGFTNNGLELDTLLGFAGKAGEVGYDVGVMRYNYPSANEATNGFEPDYNEIYGSVSFSGAKLGLAYSPEYTFESDKFVYVYADYATEVAGFGLLAHVGYNKFDSEIMAAQSVGLLNGDDYVDYKLGVSKALAGATVELAYIGSDIESEDCAVAFGDNSCEGRAVATVTKSF